MDRIAVILRKVKISMKPSDYLSDRINVAYSMSSLGVWKDRTSCLVKLANKQNAAEHLCTVR